MAAVTQKERSAKSARKRVANAEEELRLRVRPGTRQASHSHNDRAALARVVLKRGNSVNADLTKTFKKQ
ncbi:hypothetical protein [Pseudomonas extremaustralis]